MFDKRKEAPEPTPPPEPAVSQPAAPKDFTSRSSAVIGKTIKIKGTISGDENLIIEGEVDGSVDLPKNDLTIGESGKVTADLDAKVVKVDGEVTGDISGAEKVIISKSGTVKGNIVAPRVTLEDGAKFKGSIDMDPSDAKPAASSKPSLKSSPASDSGNSTGSDLDKAAG